MEFYESMAGYKPVAIQAYPVLGEKITQDTLYWNNYKVSIDKIKGGRCFTFMSISSAYFILWIC